MNIEIFEKLKEFIAQETGVKRNKITKDAEFQNDLGIYGEDIIDLLLTFGKKFNVDLSKFMAADYVAAEGEFFITKRKELRVRHLLKAIIAGKLDEEIIGSVT
jgi:acyl carrier protein